VPNYLQVATVCCGGVVDVFTAAGRGVKFSPTPKQIKALTDSRDSSVRGYDLIQRSQRGNDAP
jgi:hypothetical protein